MLKFNSKSDVNQECKCIIRLLDDVEVIECDIQPRYKAQYLLDYVCQQLDVVEKDYFGLRYVNHRKQRKWFDFTKSVANQMRDMQNLLLCFRVKFYPPDPMRLHESTRYQIYLQLKRDLQHGRLYSPGPSHDMAFLAALCLQEELGNYNPEEHVSGYVSEMNLVLNQTEKLEQQVEDYHSGRLGALLGISPLQAVNAFLRKSTTLDTYGIDPHPVKDPRGARLYIGTNHSGVATFHNGRRTHHFRWVDISKLNYEGKMFIIHLIIMEDPRTKKKHTVGFKCASSSACRQLWRYSVEQRIFFTFRSSADIPAVVTGGSFFSRGSKVRYSGKVERELSMGERQQQQQQQQQQQEQDDADDDVDSGATRVVRARQAFAANRSSSLPIRNFGDSQHNDALTAAIKAERTLPGPAPRCVIEDVGSSASASTKTSSLFAEEQDSYDGSSCGSGQSAGSQEDDRSDVASWVALDLRHLRHQHPQDNGYDVMTIDSDFYGYATSGRSSGVPEAGGSHSGTGERPLSWAGTHPTDAESQHSPDVRVRHRERHSATPSTPSHYTNTSTKQKATLEFASRRRLPSVAGSLASKGARLWTTWMLLIGTSLVTMFSFMVITLVLVYETDFHWAIHLRHWPEMVFIQRHLYAPFRTLFSL